MLHVPPHLQDYQALIEKHKGTWLEDYLTLLRFPSVSSEPQYKKGMERCAQ
jgi:hypothetical protein